MKMKIASAYILFITLAATSAQSQQPEISAVLMESTFRIQGISKDVSKRVLMGTCFFLGRQSKKDPSRTYYVLVTARHVLDEIGGDEATLLLREKIPDGTYRAFPQVFKIRNNGRNIYVSHSQFDVSAIFFDMPPKAAVKLAAASALATEAEMKRLGLHPGDELQALGFPLGATSNEMGFPILRSGKIASYPLFPIKSVKKFLLDFTVFPGNSGGPVYYSYNTRYIDGRLQAGQMQGIVGLLTQGVASAIMKGQPLEIGVVIPSDYIIETINLLPEPQ